MKNLEKMMIYKRTFILGWLLLITLLPSCFFKTDPHHIDALSPNPKILAVLSAMKIAHDGTCKDVVRVTQEKWLRPRGKERWEVEDRYASMKPTLLPLLRQAGCIDEVAPQKNYYDYVLFLGALAPRVQKRLVYLIQVWNKGVRFGAIIVLTGQRPLDPAQEGREGFETEMIQEIFEKTEFSETMKQVPVLFIDTPQQKKPDGSPRRPNTADTVAQWLKTGPSPGTCLAISNQPHVLYQDAALKTFLSKNFQVETIGEPLEPPYHILLILDALARFLYQSQYVD